MNKLLSLFKNGAPTHLTLAAKQLKDAREERLKIMLKLEHAEAQVTSYQAEVDYLAKTIARLGQYYNTSATASISK